MQMFYKALVVDNGGITEKRTEERHDRKVKVRVMGIHPFEGELDYSNVPDDALPWAKIAPSISSSNSTEKFNVPENGQWVWVFFEDEGFQQPVYFAFVTADTDVNTNFKPNKNTITTDRYNGQEQVVTNDYQSNITNGNGFFLSSTERKALLTNNSVATVLTDNKIKNYVGRDIDESEQYMVYGNHLLDCLQSTLSTLEQSFKGFKEDYNEEKIDVEGSIGQQIPNEIPLNFDVREITIPKGSEVMGQIEQQNDGKSQGDEGYIELTEEQQNKIYSLDNLNLSEIDLTEIKESVLSTMAKIPLSNIVIGGSWIGEPFYTAKISLAFLHLYKIINNLYNMLLYLKKDNDNKWKKIESKESASDNGKYNGWDRYSGISDVRDNLKECLNYYSVFVPEAQDLNQLIVDEYANGETPKSISLNANFNSIKCKEMKPENIRYIVVHCSDSNFGDADLINKWHQQNGWCKIGYHFVILNGCSTNKEYREWKEEGKDPTSFIQGAVQTGRKENEIGAHTVGYNSNSIGICLIGTNSFSEIQKASLATLIGALRDKYNIPKENILRHCETPKANGKSCPNINDTEWKAFKALLKE